ncbi:TIGR02679 family protein [Nocardia farcinica]|uniref:TIGR02679 family protein n=1 Tax=Nocardia farcinica (strain IFM 10152) TaxID=247156 RepID=Q5YRA5_NOCFA|nr:TIGR02679 family protein [Nocardia farcinica]BAD59286.1 hypothetical protein NFA_44350 [Nocardia farcinica IFM 10152]
MSIDEPRLRRILGGPETAWLMSRLRERIARGLPLTGSVRLQHPSPEQRAAVERLLGRRAGATAGISVPLDRLDEQLRRAGIHADGLEAAVRLLTGPVAVRSEAAAAADRAWSMAFAPGDRLALRHPELAGWWQRVKVSGTIRRLTGDPDAAAALLTTVGAALDALPVHREPLGVFAARVLGRAHALDAGEPVAAIVLSALRARASLGDDTDRRTVWRTAGLIVDELSSTVLTLGLTTAGRSPAEQMVNLARATGQPLVLTLRQIRDSMAAFDTADTGRYIVSVCENAAVVAAAADRLGPDCPPLVCTAGQPSAAVIGLLDLLTAAGGRLRYHGDFDWPGLTIAGGLYRRYRWQPWRFTAADYASCEPPVATAPLTGIPVQAEWDTELTVAMSRRGIQIEEELTLPQLLADLAAEYLAHT